MFGCEEGNGAFVGLHSKIHIVVAFCLMDCVKGGAQNLRKKGSILECGAVPVCLTFFPMEFWNEKACAFRVDDLRHEYGGVWHHCDDDDGQKWSCDGIV